MRRVSSSAARRSASAPARRASRSRASVVGGRQPTTIGSRCVAAPTLGRVFAHDPLLQQHDALDERLGPRRAAGHVDVDRDDLVDALGDRVRVPVGAAAVRARTHRDDVLRVGHLLVEALDRGRHLVGDGARDDDEVGLARAGRERDDAEAHHVVARAGERGAHLDRAAREAPLEHPQRVLAAVVQEVRERFRCFARTDQAHLRSPFRQTYASPRSRTATNTVISTRPNQPAPRR